jgi:hypothetical protein
MESDGLLQFLQALTTGHCPEPAESSPYFYIILDLLSGSI